MKNKIFILSVVSCLVISSLLNVNAQEMEEESQQMIVEDCIPVNQENDYFISSIDLPEYAPRQLLLKFNDNVRLDLPLAPEGEIVMVGIPSVDELNVEFGVTYMGELIEGDLSQDLSNIYQLVMSEDANIIQAMNSYKNDSNIEYVCPNYVYHLDAINEKEESQQMKTNPYVPGFIPDDPYFDMQWALHNTGQNNGTVDADLDAPEAWDTTMGDDNVVIAVVDSGVDYTHPDLGNCNDDIFEVVLDEPIVRSGDDWGETFDFEEILSDYDFDSISFHFTYMDVGPYYGPGCPPPDAGDLELHSYKNDPNDPYNDRLRSKDLFISHNYDGTAYDIWTVFSERGAKMVEMDYFTGQGHTGFEIDRVRLQKWEKLSIRCPEKYVDGIDFVDYDYNPLTPDNDPDPMDDNGHGTHCAGIISAVINNGVGVAGIASNCKIMPVRIFDQYGYTTLGTVIKGLCHAADNGADIISLSMGGAQNSLIDLAIEYVYNKGVIIISSAGNDNWSLKGYSSPASHDKVIAVAATNNKDEKTYFSNYGPWVDVAAPGHDILSLRAYATDLYLDFWNNPDYPAGYCFVPQYDNDAILYRCSGTSMSSPTVAGVAGLILAQGMSNGYLLTQSEVRTVIRSSTDPVISNKYIGTGRINANKAVDKAYPVIANLDNSLGNLNVEGQLTIKGTATGRDLAQFDEYKLYVGPGLYPNTWQEIGSSNNPCVNDILYTWNSNEVADGPYILKLEVTYAGKTLSDRKAIIVDNEMMTYKVNDDYDESTPGFGTEKFNVIQEVIDICGASDTIYVYKGTYYEQLVIEYKSVAIQGEDKDNTIIDSTDKEWETITIFSGILNLYGLTIKTKYSYEYEAPYASIIGVESSNCNIKNNNIISEVGNGAVVFQGALLDSSTNSYNKIDENVVYYVGIVFGEKNIISDNTCEIIEIYYMSDENEIKNNNVESIILEMANKNKIHDNIISNGSVGTEVFNGDKNQIYSNTYEDNTNAIKICTGKNNNIYENLIKNNEHGINFYVEYYISSNVITKNTISDNVIGIHFEGSYFSSDITYNTISKNNISNNVEYGILVEDSGSSPNYFYYNNFINNGVNAQDCRENIWNHPLLSKGNYWSDYEEKYPNANKLPNLGIWDTPYEIPGGNNKDNYPLFEEYTQSVNIPDQSQSTTPDQQQSSSQQTQGSSTPVNNPTNN